MTDESLDPCDTSAGLITADAKSDSAAIVAVVIDVGRAFLVDSIHLNTVRLAEVCLDDGKGTREKERRAKPNCQHLLLTQPRN